MRELYGAPSYGTVRASYIDDEAMIVYKVPRLYADDELVMDCIQAQGIEAAPHMLYPCAASRELLDAYGIPVIVMEWVDIDSALADREHWPAWTEMVDQHQVGYAADGQLVCFDWSEGIDPTAEALDLALMPTARCADT
jgi:hypothetical protein